MAKNLGAYDGVLCKVLGSAATHHEEACLRGSHLDASEFDEVAHRVDAEVFLALVGALPLVLSDAESGAAVAEGGAEDRHTALVAGLNKAVFLDGAAVVEPFAELVEELAAAVGASLQHVGELVGGVVASLELLLVDEGVVDAVDIELTQHGVGDDVFLGSDIVFESESLEEVHIDDGGAGRNHHVNHLVLHHIHINLHTASGAGGASESEDVGAVVFFAHHRQDVGGTSGVAAGERHAAHGVDKLGGVVLLDVDVFDGFF